MSKYKKYSPFIDPDSEDLDYQLLISLANLVGVGSCWILDYFQYCDFDDPYEWEFELKSQEHQIFEL